MSFFDKINDVLWFDSITEQMCKAINVWLVEILMK